MSNPSCREFRELLGVYVVGAIEPAERAAVDAHLTRCYECREELAGLAPLPALLHRVSPQDAERILLATPPSPDPAEPSAEMLDSLLERVGARRRTKRLRSLFATAAAILIAVGGAVGVSEALHPQQRSVEVTTATNGLFTATVRYAEDSRGGTQMWVRVHGFRPGTSCKFWVLTKDGSRHLAGGWVVEPGGNMFWYPAHSHVAQTKLATFEISWQGHRLRIPAT